MGIGRDGSPIPFQKLAQVVLHDHTDMEALPVAPGSGLLKKRNRGTGKHMHIAELAITRPFLASLYIVFQRGMSACITSAVEN